MKAIRPCYPEGKTKAFTLSYDDGTVEDRRLVPIFNKTSSRQRFTSTPARFSKGTAEGFPKKR